MIRTFLRARHWQLFLTIFAIPMFIYMMMMNVMMSEMVNQMPGFAEGEIAPNEMAEMMETMMGHTVGFIKVFSVIMTFMILAMFGWYWAICVGLQAKVPEHAKMNVKKFKIFYFIGLFYSLFAMGLVALFATYLPNIISGVLSFGSLGTIVSVMTLIHFLAMFAMLYCLYFAAKTIKTIELQRETTFSDFVGEFVLIWFFPIGVWLLQPKINEFATKDFSTDEMDWLEED